MAACCVLAPTRVDAEPAAPHLVVEQTELDLGVREPGPKIEFVFRLKNTGTAPLEIVEAKPKCGCVVASYDREITAGGAGTVTAVLDTANHHGTLVKHLLLFSNDPENSEIPLTVKVTLRHPVEVAPSDLIFALQPGKGEEQEVMLQSFEPAPLRVLKVVSSAPYVRAELLSEESATPESGAEHPSRQRLRVSVLPGAPATAFSATVTILTGSAKRPRVVLNVSGYPAGSVNAVPPRIYFDDVPLHPEEPIVRPITLMKRDGSFQLLGAESSDPVLHVQVFPNPSGHFCEIAVRYTGGWKPGLVKGTIVLKTSDPTRPRIEVPYTAEVGP